mgnify:CR=1 FL=1
MWSSCDPTLVPKGRETARARDGFGWELRPFARPPVRCYRYSINTRQTNGRREADGSVFVGRSRTLTRVRPRDWIVARDPVCRVGRRRRERVAVARRDRRGRRRGLRRAVRVERRSRAPGRPRAHARDRRADRGSRRRWGGRGTRRLAVLPPARRDRDRDALPARRGREPDPSAPVQRPEVHGHDSPQGPCSRSPPTGTCTASRTPAATWRPASGTSPSPRTRTSTCSSGPRACTRPRWTPVRPGAYSRSRRFDARECRRPFQPVTDDVRAELAALVDDALAGRDDGDPDTL